MWSKDQMWNWITGSVCVSYLFIWKQGKLVIWNDKRLCEHELCVNLFEHINDLAYWCVCNNKSENLYMYMIDYIRPYDICMWG